MTLLSFKKVLQFKQKQQQQQEHVEVVKKSSTFESSDDDSVEQDEANAVVLVENHLDDQPSETEVVLTTTTTYEQQEGFLPEGLIDQCTKVQFDDDAEIILNTDDLSGCTSVLIEQEQWNTQSETEMVLTTARMKPIQEEEEGEEEIQVDEDAPEEDVPAIPEVVPASDDDLIVVLTDNKEDLEKAEEEEAKEEALVQEEEEIKQQDDVIDNASDDVSVSLQSYMAYSTRKEPEEVVDVCCTTTPTDAAPIQDLMATPQDCSIFDSSHFDNVSVSLQSYQNVISTKDETKMVPTKVQVNDDSSLIDECQDNVSVSLQSYKMTTMMENDCRTTKFYCQSARLSRPGVGNHRGNAQATQPEDTMSQWARQLDHDDDDADNNILTSLLLMLPTTETAAALASLQQQHQDMWTKLIQNVSATTTKDQPRRPTTRPKANFSIVYDEDDDVATAGGQSTLGQTTIATESTALTTVVSQDPLALLQDMIAEYGSSLADVDIAASLPNVDQEIVLLAHALDPSQLGHLVANNVWLQQKAKEKVGIRKEEFRQIISDLLFL